MGSQLGSDLIHWPNRPRGWHLGFRCGERVLHMRWSHHKEFSEARSRLFAEKACPAGLVKDRSSLVRPRNMPLADGRLQPTPEHLLATRGPDEPDGHKSRTESLASRWHLPRAKAFRSETRDTCRRRAS